MGQHRDCLAGAGGVFALLVFLGLHEASLVVKNLGRQWLRRLGRWMIGRCR